MNWASFIHHNSSHSIISSRVLARSLNATRCASRSSRRASCACYAECEFERATVWRRGRCALRGCGRRAAAAPSSPQLRRASAHVLCNVRTTSSRILSRSSKQPLSEPALASTATSLVAAAWSPWPGVTETSSACKHKFSLCAAWSARRFARIWSQSARTSLRAVAAFAEKLAC